MFIITKLWKQQPCHVSVGDWLHNYGTSYNAVFCSYLERSGRSECFDMSDVQVYCNKKKANYRTICVIWICFYFKSYVCMYVCFKKVFFVFFLKKMHFSVVVGERGNIISAVEEQTFIFFINYCIILGFTRSTVYKQKTQFEWLQFFGGGNLTPICLWNTKKMLSILFTY